MELTGQVDLDFSGVGLALEEPSAAVEAGVRREWSGFLAAGAGPPFLRCSFASLGAAAPPGPFLPKRMRSHLGVAAASFEMPEGRAEVAAGGDARIALASGLGEREFWTAMNLLRACLAWRLPDRAAALVHAAGLVVDGRGYLLVGPEGSGKSSWARIGESAGARVISDDLVLVEAGPSDVSLLGAPFRSTHRADYRPGRWPIAALLFPERGRPAAWRPAPALLARARILANLPFVADAPSADTRVGFVAGELARRVPCLDLTFALEASFVELLRRGPEAGQRSP